MRAVGIRETNYAKYVASGYSSVEAYHKAFDCEGLNDVQIRNRAKSLDNNPNVQSEIEYQSREYQKQEQIDRDFLIKTVRELIDVSKENAYERVGDKTKLHPTSAKILLATVERACKMVGADQPDKVDTSIKIQFSDGIDEYGH